MGNDVERESVCLSSCSRSSSSSSTFLHSFDVDFGFGFVCFSFNLLFSCGWQHCYLRVVCASVLARRGKPLGSPPTTTAQSIWACTVQNVKSDRRGWRGSDDGGQLEKRKGHLRAVFCFLFCIVFFYFLMVLVDPSAGGWSREGGKGASFFDLHFADFRWREDGFMGPFFA